MIIDVCSSSAADRLTDRQVVCLTAGIATAGPNLRYPNAKVSHTRPVCRLPGPALCACALRPQTERRGSSLRTAQRPPGSETVINAEQRLDPSSVNPSSPAGAPRTNSGRRGPRRADAGGGRQTGSLPVCPPADGKTKREEAAASAAFTRRLNTESRCRTRHEPLANGRLNGARVSSRGGSRDRRHERGDGVMLAW